MIMKNIDTIFAEAESQKHIELKTVLWDRLERKLDEKRTHQVMIRKYLSIAAGLIIIVVAFVAIHLNHKTTYILEDLDRAHHPTLNSEAISQMHQYPAIYKRFSWDLNG
jgi:hypothetical protein